jgi:hypothetical protein
MTTLKDLTTAQLQRIIDIKQQIETLQSQLDSIAGRSGRGPGRPKGKRRMSAAGRRAIAKAARKRWAKYRGKAGKKAKPARKRKVSAAARAKLAAAAKARWARAKAEGKKTL